MYEKLIKNNINLLNKDITKEFLRKKGIYVTDNEAIIITDLAKSNWQKLYNKDYKDVFLKLKMSIKKETYDSLLNLYLTYIRDYL